jgi:hypothetical protein
LVNPVGPETWEWDGAVWTLRTMVAGPGTRSLFAIAYDAAREHIVLFGGRSAIPTRTLGDTLTYGTRAKARYTGFGLGCAGTAGVPTLAALGGRLPWLADTFQVELTSLVPGQPVVLNLGFSDRSWGALSLPQPLDRLGMPGCSLYVGAELAFGLANAGGTATWSVPIPNDRDLRGLRFFQQGLAADPGANRLGATVTNGAAGTVGAR